MSEDIKKALSKFKLEDYDSPEAFRAAAAKAGLTEAQTAEVLERIKSAELSDQELSSIVGGGIYVDDTVKVDDAISQQSDFVVNMTFDVVSHGNIPILH